MRFQHDGRIITLKIYRISRIKPVRKVVSNLPCRQDVTHSSSTDASGKVIWKLSSIYTTASAINHVFIHVIVLPSC